MNILENDYVKFWKEEEILFSTFKKPTELGLKETIETIELRHTISGKEHQYWCLDYRNLKSASKEAHNYSDKYGQEFLFACAVVVNSHITRFIIEVFNRVKKPKVPLKIFISKESAVLWLREMKAQNTKAF